MKSKNELAWARYGRAYVDCCWLEKRRIDGMFLAQDEEKNEDDEAIEKSEEAENKI